MEKLTYRIQLAIKIWRMQREVDRLTRILSNPKLYQHRDFVAKELNGLIADIRTFRRIQAIDRKFFK